jgi:rhamnulokinase
MTLPAPTIAPVQLMDLCMDKEKNPPAYLALDLGAESGRAVLGRLEDKKLVLKEIHRFPNRPVEAGGSLYWDVLYLWNELKHGLSLAAIEARGQLVSLGIDSWGVDFALLDTTGTLLGNPYCYRDNRTDGMVEAANVIIPCRDIYQLTGNQVMPINSLFQLIAMAKSNSGQLAAARTFLNIPDLFNFWFTGVKASEFTISTTTQCYDPREKDWAWDMIEKMGIHSDIFEKIVPPGTIIGNLNSRIAEETHTGAVKVVAVASHDTQSAIFAVPAQTHDFLYLSSGTWSLMGTEVETPLISQEGFENELTNEGGFEGKFCFLKNIVGLWILQECRRVWADNGLVQSYDELTKLAASAPAFHAFINPGDPIFFPPGDMVNRIQNYCRKSGQPVPEGPAEVTRCILESLAFEYRIVAGQISKITGRDFTVIHIIGGGSQNSLLNQMTANSTGLKVISGPVETTAIGNILMQAMAVGEVKSIVEAREIVRNSFPVEVYTPLPDKNLLDAYSRFIELKDKGKNGTN